MTTPLGQVTGELQDVREITSYYGTNANGPSLSNTKTYTGGYSFRNQAQCNHFGVLLPSAQTAFRAGVWCNHNSIYSGTNARATLLYARSASLPRVEVRWKRSTATLDMAIDGTIQSSVGVSAISLDIPDTWMHFGLTYIAGAPGRTAFFLNGIEILSYEGTLTGDIVSVLCGGNPLTHALTDGGYGWANYAYFDDFYVDGGIETHEAPPPDRFLASLASAAGDSAQWTPTGAATNVACVDEAVPNDDTDYVKAETVDLVDLYETADITLPTDYGIVSVIPIALVKRMASGPTVKLVAADGVSTNLESSEQTPGTTYGYVSATMPLAPDGGDWTEAKVNAAQFGIKSTGVYA